MGKWEMVRLGDVCEIVSGTTPKSNVEKYWNGTQNWVTPAELKEDTVEVIETDRKITELAIKESGLKPFPAGTVLLSSRAPIGKVAIAGTSMYCNQGFKNLVCSAHIVNKYLYWFLKGKTNYLNSLGRGATFKEISKAIVQSIELPLPSLDEQKRIAKNLDLASEIVKGYKEQLAELDKLVQSVFYEMFGDPVTNEKGWEVTCLSEVCKKITDGTHNSPENLETGEYRYITAKNIKREGILLSNITYVTKQVHEEIYARCNPEMGDVLYIKDGVTTGIAVVNTLNEPFSMLSSVALLKLKDTICNKYLCNVLNCKEMYQKIRENMGGAAITRLTLVKIKNIQIPLPPLSLQTRFASIVTEIEAQKAQIQQAQTEAENLFNSLMQEYFE